VIVAAIAIGIATGVPPIKTEGKAVWRPAVPGDSVPRSITEAEREGSEYPRSDKPAAFPTFPNYPVRVGTADRRCVVVGNAEAARSGDFVAVSFRGYVEEWRLGRTGSKMVWAAGHRAPIGERLKLTITASRVDTLADAYVYVSEARTYRWPAAMLIRHGWAGGEFVPLPSAGRWLLVARVGKDWGCFVLDLS
jgi:hypothetical protein